MLTKKQIFEMIVDKCETNNSTQILRIMKNEIGFSISRDLLVTMPTSAKAFNSRNAEIVANFLSVDIDSIPHHGKSHKNHTWDFSVAAQRMADVSRLWRN